jgi:hypothetical protein
VTFIKKQAPCCNNSSVKAVFTCSQMVAVVLLSESFQSLLCHISQDLLFFLCKLCFVLCDLEFSPYHHGLSLTSRPFNFSYFFLSSYLRRIHTSLCPSTCVNSCQYLPSCLTYLLRVLKCRLGNYSVMSAEVIFIHILYQGNGITIKINPV